MYVNVDTPNLGFTYFTFLGGGAVKKPPCIFYLYFLYNLCDESAAGFSRLGSFCAPTAPGLSSCCCCKAARRPTHRLEREGCQGAICKTIFSLRNYMIQQSARKLSFEKLCDSTFLGGACNRCQVSHHPIQLPSSGF